MQKLFEAEQNGSRVEMHLLVGASCQNVANTQSSQHAHMSQNSSPDQREAGLFKTLLFVMLYMYI